MIFDFTGISICIDKNALSAKAAGYFAQEIKARTGLDAPISVNKSAPSVSFVCDSSIENKDAYNLELKDGILTIKANGIRGLIYGYSYFLRKITVSGVKITLIKDISGSYSPQMSIRGHQLGYRTTPNTYDAWDPDQYSRYMRDMMFFGCNMMENMPDSASKKRNVLMKYEPNDMLIYISERADELDMDYSIWYPNNDDDTLEEALEDHHEVFKSLPRLNVCFPPGGDPGKLDGDDFYDRIIEISKLMKEDQPNAEMWPSAQKPHECQNWGELFMEKMQSEQPDLIKGVITGPNWAFTLDDLRRQLPMKYPIRLYPDITHNVRCEYPVHFPRDDWHFAMTSGLSRESINPRPVEYRFIHRLTRQYIVGSCSYSEGVHDDLNKMIWSDMDYFGENSLRESILDYCRVFFYGAPADIITDAIFGLEQNWYGDPVENGHIENTLNMFNTVLGQCPFLIDNWRYCMCLFRARCDALVRRRRIFELELIEKAKYFIKNGDLANAKAALMTDFSDEYISLRQDLEVLALRLFNQIGIQLDVERYHTDGWERGGTLDTIDLPVTDRRWLLNRFDYAEKFDEKGKIEFMNRVIERNKVDKDEYYFSFAEHGTDVLGVPQEGFIYYNFQGDRRGSNDGSIPTCMLKVFDNLTLKAKLGGFTPGRDYKLRITFRDETYPVFIHHHVIANGVTIYDGKQFGGERDEKFDEELVAPKFVTVTYDLPASVFVNGCVELEIGEPYMGVFMSEFWIIKA